MSPDCAAFSAVASVRVAGPFPAGWSTVRFPLASLPQRVNELDTEDEIVLHCKSGMRSMKGLGVLQQFGFKKLHNLKGGITAWADDVDPSVAKY